MKLENKVVVITGGIRDIGRAISLRLAQEGAKLAINYYDAKEQAEQTFEEVKAAGAEATLVEGDMTNQEDVQRFVNATTEAFGDTILVFVSVFFCDTALAGIIRTACDLRDAYAACFPGPGGLTGLCQGFIP